MFVILEKVNLLQNKLPHLLWEWEQDLIHIIQLLFSLWKLLLTKKFTHMFLFSQSFSWICSTEPIQVNPQVTNSASSDPSGWAVCTTRQSGAPRPSPPAAQGRAHLQRGGIRLVGKSRLATVQNRAVPVQESLACPWARTALSLVPATAAREGCSSQGNFPQTVTKPHSVKADTAQGSALSFRDGLQGHSLPGWALYRLISGSGHAQPQRDSLGSCGRSGGGGGCGSSPPRSGWSRRGAATPPRPSGACPRTRRSAPPPPWCAWWRWCRRAAAGTASSRTSATRWGCGNGEGRTGVSTLLGRVFQNLQYKSTCCTFQWVQWPPRCYSWGRGIAKEWSAIWIPLAPRLSPSESLSHRAMLSFL